MAPAYERAATVDLSDRVPARSWWRGPALWTAAVVLYALVLDLQIGLPAPIALRESSVYLYSLAILSIPARWWMRKTMAAGRPSAGQLALHVAAGLATVGVWFISNILYTRYEIGPAYWTIVYQGNWIFQLAFAITVYGTVLGLTMTTYAWQRERDRDRREAELRVLARDAELGAIRAQFQPHFVLNALNSLLALIDSDPALARTMVVRLADVMTSVFDRMDVPAVPLERELELIKAYLDVERIRFGARLQVAFEIEDAARGVLVPPFLLQPIVENAIKHGIAPSAAPGTIRVRARIRDRQLDLEVLDSGAGNASVPGSGRGLALTRRRLETTYRDAYELTFDRGAAGTAVRITMPTDAHVA
ncbi:MAG TPA: histidine kinase [Vicinamibacterales bacterium]|nr:histidine kinase [Vicinamibacterales bacterium]